MRASGQEPKRYPWWQLILLGLASMLESLIVRPIRRLWVSDDPLDTYAMVHLATAAGDVMVAIALAGSIFFDVPVGEARAKVALYLAVTLAPLAVAGPLLVPLLDRAGPRRGREAKEMRRVRRAGPREEDSDARARRVPADYLR